MSQTKFNRLTVKVYAWFTKTLNASNGSDSYLMKGGDVTYTYKGEKKVPVGKLEEFIAQHKDRILEKIINVKKRAKDKSPKANVKVKAHCTTQGSSRVMKGIRGAIRHSIMSILHQKGMEYCTPTKKPKFTGSGDPTLLEGEHLMGECGDTPCAIRQLFGMLGEKSPIRVWADVLVQTQHPLESITKQLGVSFIHISTENRHASRRDGKVLQDFTEQYFSGVVQFYIEFTNEIPTWLLGLLIEGILSLQHLGRGSNSGYGRLEIRELVFAQVTFERTLGSTNNGSIQIIDNEQIELQNHLVQEYLDAWRDYN